MKDGKKTQNPNPGKKKRRNFNQNLHKPKYTTKNRKTAITSLIEQNQRALAKR